VKPSRALVIAVIGMTLIATACGSDDATKSPSDSPTSRTVEIEMRDMAFSPDRVTVPAGETVRLVFTNTGEAVHDAFIGDEDAQNRHEMEMVENADAGHSDDHDDSDEGAITVDPGDTGTLTHTFEAGDALLIGCHQPGHYAAGMKLTIDVT
jgi:uncharacterized cupredoxin-like copper-binding protein